MADQILFDLLNECRAKILVLEIHTQHLHPKGIAQGPEGIEGILHCSSLGRTCVELCRRPANDLCRVPKHYCCHNEESVPRNKCRRPGHMAKTLWGCKLSMVLHNRHQE